MKTKCTVNLNQVNKVNTFVNEMSTFSSDIDIYRGRYVCDAKSIMALFSLDLSKPLDIEIHSDDEDEIARFNEIVAKYEA